MFKLRVLNKLTAATKFYPHC